MRLVLAAEMWWVVVRAKEVLRPVRSVQRVLRLDWRGVRVHTLAVRSVVSRSGQRCAEWVSLSRCEQSGVELYAYHEVTLLDQMKIDIGVRQRASRRGAGWCCCI